MGGPERMILVFAVMVKRFASEQRPETKHLLTASDSVETVKDYLTNDTDAIRTAEQCSTDEKVVRKTGTTKNDRGRLNERPPRHM